MLSKSPILKYDEKKIPKKNNFCFSGYFNGWLCFYGSLAGIGLMTAIIGDVASHFGCSVGLKDSITAIGLVAMGTSLPGKQKPIPSV